jgi:hypothetical protein
MQTACDAAFPVAPRADSTSLIVPSFDLADFAADVDQGAGRPSGFAAVYARVVGGNFTLEEAASANDAWEPGVVDRSEIALDVADIDLDRAMYASYLESNFPEALELAERVLDRDPSHGLAKLVISACVDAIGCDEERVTTATEPHGSFR